MQIKRFLPRAKEVWEAWSVVRRWISSYWRRHARNRNQSRPWLRSLVRHPTPWGLGVVAQRMNHAVVNVSRRTKQKQKCRSALAEVSRFPYFHFPFSHRANATRWCRLADAKSFQSRPLNPESRHRSSVAIPLDCHRSPEREHSDLEFCDYSCYREAPRSRLDARWQSLWRRVRRRSSALPEQT